MKEQIHRTKNNDNRKKQTDTWKKKETDAKLLKFQMIWVYDDKNGTILRFIFKKTIIVKEIYLQKF